MLTCTLNRDTFKGNLVNWDRAKFDLINITEVDVPMKDVCVPIRPGHVVMPVLKSFADHQSLCKKFRGTTSVVSDQDTQDMLNKEIAKYPDCTHFTGTFFQSMTQYHPSHSK